MGKFRTSSDSATVTHLWQLVLWVLVSVASPVAVAAPITDGSSVIQVALEWGA